MIVLLGRYNLGDKTESDAINRRVSKIDVHPDWSYSSESWDADVAIIALEKIVKFSAYIQPVCMPADDNVEDYDEGTVVSRHLFL